MYNKKSSVFLSLHSVQKVVPVLFSLCILLHDFRRKGRRGCGTGVGRSKGSRERIGSLFGSLLNLSLLYLLLRVSFYDKGLSHCCDGAGQGSRQRVPNIVVCPFSPMASWFIGVIFGL